MLYELLIGALEHVGATMDSSEITYLAASTDAEKRTGGQEWIQPALLLLDMVAQPLLVDKTTPLQSAIGELERITIIASNRDIYVSPDLPNTVSSSGLTGIGENAADKTLAVQTFLTDNDVEGK